MLMTIFDKSFIHAISAEEAAVFDMHFMSNITPLFFVEVLADLEKNDREAGREALVKSLAGKTPVYHSYPNMPHSQIIWGELTGNLIELRRVPVVGGGRRVRSSEGLGTVFDEPPEMKAKSRWHAGEFGANEYVAARAWRDALQAAPQQTIQLLGNSADKFSFADLAAIKRHVDRQLNRDGWRFATLKRVLDFLSIPPDIQREVIQRWKQAGGPRLTEFIPFTAHVVAVDLFRILAMGCGHIAVDKTSNHADIAYLYYLPFCEVFISTDKLHRRCAPFFLSPSQEFVWGNDLRPHLTKLAEDYLADPEIETLGLIGVAQKTKFPQGTFIGDLIRRLHPRYSDADNDDFASRLTPEQEREMVGRLTAARDSPPPEEGYNPEEEDKTISFTRSVPVRRGRFAFMPQRARS